MLARFIKVKTYFAKEWLEDNNIPFREWSNEQDEYELRICITDLSKELLDKVISEFSISCEDMKECDYLILWG